MVSLYIIVYHCISLQLTHYFKDWHLLAALWMQLEKLAQTGDLQPIPVGPEAYLGSPAQRKNGSCPPMVQSQRYRYICA